MSQKIKALMNDEKTRENESDMSNEDLEEEEQDSDQSEQDSDQNSEESDSALKSDQENESESENEMKAFQNQLKKASKSKKDLVKDDSERDSDSENENQMKDLDINEADSDENMSENGDFSENDSESEDDFDNEMGPDLSEMLKNDESSDDENAENEESDAKLFSDKNVQKEVEKGKCIKSQLQIWDSLLELRISLQKSLSKINQFPLDLKPFKENKDKSDEEENELKQSQVNLAKVLDQLLDLKKSMLSKNKVFSRPDEPLGKKRKLNDYEKYLDTRFDSMKSWRNETMEDWNDRTRIVGSKNGFSGFETSVTRQIEHILADKPRLVKRTKMKRTIYDVIGQEATEESHNDEIFDDDDFYHQLLRELIERKTSGVTDPVALGQQWLQLQKIRAKAKKKVDTKASKGRKTRYDIHAKLVNFMAPTYPKSNLSEEAKTELFASLFRG